MRRHITVFIMIIAVFMALPNMKAVQAKEKRVYPMEEAGLVVDGNRICMTTGKGIYMVNKKTKSVKKISSQKNVYGMTIYKGYLYYSSSSDAEVYQTYKVKLTGGKPKRLAGKAEMSFIRNGRIYYFDQGICSMNLKGTDRKRHTRVDAQEGEVIYRNNKFIVYYTVLSPDGYHYYAYSLNNKFKNQQDIEEEDFTSYRIQFHNNSMPQYGVGTADVTYDVSGSEVQSDTIKGTKTIFTSKKKYVHVTSAGHGYVLIKEGNSENSSEWLDNRIIGNYRLITTKGKTVKTFR